MIKAASFFAIGTAIPLIATMIWGDDNTARNVVFVSSFPIYFLFIYFTVDALADVVRYERSKSLHPVLGVVMPKKDTEDAVLSDEKGVK
jgi:hypothetical protein